MMSDDVMVGGVGFWIWGHREDKVRLYADDIVMFHHVVIMKRNMSP